MRCSPGALCARMNAFGKSRSLDAIWASADSQMLAVVADGKLGISLSAGKDAVWHDLPAGISRVGWLDWNIRETRRVLYLGTREGLFTSDDGGIRWTRGGNGLPAAPINDWLDGGNFLLASLTQGGLFLSRDEGIHWMRVDEDEERGRTAGLVQTAPGRILVGSQGEGVLQLELVPKK
jgi:hypothetical protein